MNNIDLSTCRPGQKLISCHGEILTFVGMNPTDYPYTVRYNNGSIGTRTQDGQTFTKKKLETDHDIVQILPFSEFVRTTENTFLKFYDEDNKEKLVSINDILVSGYPMDSEANKDLEMVNERVYDVNGYPI